MRISQEAKGVYERTNKIWTDNGFTIRFGEPSEPADFKTAVQCIKQFWLKEFNQEFPYEIINDTYIYRKGKFSWIVSDYNRGKRDNKSKLDGYYIYRLSPDTGWANIIHDAGHLAGAKLGHGHNAEHACIELRFTKFFFSKNYIEKSRKRIEANKNIPTKHIEINKPIKRQNVSKVICIYADEKYDWCYFKQEKRYYHKPIWEFEDKRITKACSKYSENYEDCAADYWAEYKWELDEMTWKQRSLIIATHRIMKNKDIDDYAKKIMKGV